MLTLDEALAEQNNLELLCQPRSGNRHEYYEPNDNYGFAYVVKKYAGYPVEQPIFATIPHGIYFRDKVIPNHELKFDLPAVLNYPPFTTPLWRKAAKHKKIIPFASPIHYALKLFRQETPQQERSGTLFMPKHSTAAVGVKFDKEAVLDELMTLPEKFHPITACIHWHDVKLGLHKYFQMNGIRTVSAGHITDYNYLFRWLHLVGQHKLVAGCGLSSSIFYSTLADTPFYLTKEDVAVDSKARLFNKNGAQFSSKALKRIEIIREVFGAPLSKVTAQQNELANYYTHGELVGSPEAVLRTLNSLKSLLK